MKPTAQSGMHPDAESLTAFAEQLLPAAERDQILVHMTTCRRCREVVFLAQHAASEDQPAAVTVVATAKQRAPWFSGWKWMWIPATAFAGLIGLAVVQHFRQAAPETQMAAKLSQTDAFSNPEPAKAPATTPKSAIHPTEELQKAQKANPSEVRDDSLSRADKDQLKQLGEQKSIEQNELAVGASGTPNGASPALAGGSVHGTMAGKAKSSPYDGPAAANQFQQQNPAQPNAGQESQDVAADATNKPATASAAPASESQAVTVQAEKKELAPKAALAAPPQAPSVSLSNLKYDGLDKVQKIILPSGLGALSVASEGSRSIALDTAGTMFLSEDDGKHWQPIHAQWTGRAIRVRNQPVGTQATSLRASQTTRFELVNEQLQTWVSYDGKTWIPEPDTQK
jgi:hypothetical protein